VNVRLTWCSAESKLITVTKKAFSEKYAQQEAYRETLKASITKHNIPYRRNNSFTLYTTYSNEADPFAEKPGLNDDESLVVSRNHSLKSVFVF